ncbi:hypothetical protein [Methylobacterium tardum]|jgi:hypothetical protein|nr:hypothetical protein [Methylobacterium tardum]URD38922.1 hypothetical protein M6G65_11195 [Methylobacterium tardum]
MIERVAGGFQSPQRQYRRVCAPRRRRIVAMPTAGVSSSTEGVSSAKMEETMAYKITFRKGKRVSATKLWPCDLEAAIAHARAQLPLQRDQSGATSVSVTCERTGDVVFTCTEQPESLGV